MYERILVACKDGTADRPLLQMAIGVANPGASLTLATAVTVGKDADEAERLAAARRELEELAGEARDRGVEVDCRVELSATTAGAEVLRAAEQTGADLVVIGLGRRSRVGKALLGSDAQTVLMGATVPVMCWRHPGA